MLKPPWLQWLPLLVAAIDLVWGWSLSTFARPWLLRMLNLAELQASRYAASVLEPRLWISYAIVLATQLTWVNLIAPRALSRKQLRQLWWMGCFVIITSSAVLWQGLSLPVGAEWLLLGVQVGDLLLLYWLSTRLLTPLPQRRVIPGWW